MSKLLCVRYMSHSAHTSYFAYRLYGHCHAGKHWNLNTRMTSQCNDRRELPTVENDLCTRQAINGMSCGIHHCIFHFSTWCFSTRDLRMNIYDYNLKSRCLHVGSCEADYRRSFACASSFRKMTRDCHNDRSLTPLLPSRTHPQMMGLLEAHPSCPPVLPSSIPHGLDDLRRNCDHCVSKKVGATRK